MALLGLTFKPDTDDLREAPSLTIAEAAMAAGARVVAYDPMAPARIRAASLLPGLEIVDSARGGPPDADVAGLVTEWPEFLSLDWAGPPRLMRSPAIVDGRNALDPDAVFVGRCSTTSASVGRSAGVVPARPPGAAAGAVADRVEMGQSPPWPPTDIATWTEIDDARRCSTAGWPAAGLGSSGRLDSWSRRAGR